ncbi:MAG: NAD(P)(+) transhydrogenase (Re/Si-specific) subunit beta [Deltaproteobacteria bacterium]|nr:NAD(P)(+) transhydrogenase (Re/Si-specific) subunit beta [Deltaproteobacteria bacterium]
MSDGLNILTDLAIIVLLIAGFWQFRTPKGALRGNLTAAVALLCTLIVVLYRHSYFDLSIIVSAFALGSLAGSVVALRATMIQIPAMIAFQHGAGGVAAFIVSAVELYRYPATVLSIGRISGFLGVVIGAATFSASMIASGKLANRIKQTPTILPLHDGLILGTLLLIITLGTVSWNATGSPLIYYLVSLVFCSIVLGVVFSVRVGGADMPVLISFLNATAGLAAAFCGIIIQNRLLIACGATVAASGSILTRAMCNAMNRSLVKVLIGIRPKTNGVDSVKAKRAQDEPEALSEKVATAAALPVKEDYFSRAVEAVRNARSVVIVPGYGMALAQAQFDVAKLGQLLETMGKSVCYVVHPVAGRMPGHMNVLLAEAEVDYDHLREMESFNPQFQSTDLALVVGACDVVNSAAIEIEGTPISGMPILMVHEARNVIICNLDEKPGYSGVPNPLYKDPRVILLIGDAKESVNRLLRSLSNP